MLNRYFFLGSFLFFLILFGFLVFWVPEKEGAQKNEKEIVWIEKPSFILLKDLKSGNPVLRREAIIKLGEKRVKRAIKPLFDILMGSEYPLYEKQLAAKSVAMITGESIIPRALKILEEVVRSNKEESKDEVLSMLNILKNVHITDRNLVDRDLSVIDTLLKESRDNDIVLNAIQTIENLGYTKSFYHLANIYDRSMFYKIAVLKAMTKLALEDSNLIHWFRQFLNKTIWRESHDSIQHTIRESFFTIEFKRNPTQNESVLIGYISDLNSSSFKKILEAEKKLESRNFRSPDYTVLQFFLKDVNPLVVNRLLTVLNRKNFYKGLKEHFLEIVQNRYAGNKDYRDVYIDSARKALKLFSKGSLEEQEIDFIVNQTRDYFLGGDALECLTRMVLNGRETEMIQKKTRNLHYSQIKQKQFVFPLLQFYMALNDQQRVQQVFYSGQAYYKYNTVNLVLQKENFPQEDPFLKVIEKQKEPVIQSLLTYYGKNSDQ
jgi:hypothetical protein